MVRWVPACDTLRRSMKDDSRIRYEPQIGSRRSMVAQLAAFAAAGVTLACERGDRPFRFSGIPDAGKEQLSQRYDVVARHLGRALDRPVEYVHVPDYTAAVTALASGKVDAAWLGGVTAVQAERRTPRGVTFVVAREADLNFKSYFIAHRAWVDDARVSAVRDRSPGTLSSLVALGPIFARGSFSFGAKNSTSGHVMPRWFLSSPEVGLSPESGFRVAPIYQRKGGHAATLQAVASGAVDFGVVNYAAWESATEELRSAAPVIFVTPAYVDYCFVARADVGLGLLAELSKSFVALDATRPQDREVLDVFSAQRFVAVQPEQWDQIRAVVTQLEST